MSNSKSCIIKPIRCGLIEGEKEEGVIFTSEVEINDINKQRIQACPIFLQELIPKKADVRVTVVGDRLFPALIHSQEEKESEVDWRRTDKLLKYSEVKLPEELETKCLALAEKLSLSFAAIDFILTDDDEYIFLEINPNGQWAWIEKQLKFKISDEIVSLLAKN